MTCRDEQRKVQRSSWGFAFVFTVMTLGCRSTEGPLIVRKHDGAAGTPAAAGVSAAGTPAAAGTGAANTIVGGSGTGVAGAAGADVIRGGAAGAGLGGAAGAGLGGAAGASSSLGGAAGASSKGTAPARDVAWQVQLTGRFDATVDVGFYYIDPDNLTPSELLALTNVGRHVACYLSAGTYEPWRSDAAAFPTEVLGNVLAGYPDERWLDIRSSVVRAIMSARLDRMRSSGCNSIAVANVTTGVEASGLEVSTADQTAYLLWLSNEIHARNLIAGLATADDRLAQMEPYFDWAYAQGCWTDERCRAYTPFVQATKAVFAVEIGDSSNAPAICQGVLGSHVNLLVKPEDLGADRIACLSPESDI